MQLSTPAVFTLVIGLNLSIISGCGGDTKTEDTPQQGTDTSVSAGPKSQLPPWQDPRYADWRSATFENVVINFPAGHMHEAQMPQAAKDYKAAITRISNTLGLPVPADTIRVYYFTGPGLAYEYTYADYPYGDSLAIYYWPNYSRGVSMTQHLLYRYFGGWSKHRILNHGLSALFDFSGENHHQTTLEYLRDTFFIPLGKLADDPAMNSAIERHQSGEAGSFVAFLLANYGFSTLDSLYRSSLPFDSAVQKFTNKSVDSLQKEWVGFIEMAIGPIDTTKVNSGS